MATVEIGGEIVIHDESHFRFPKRVIAHFKIWSWQPSLARALTFSSL